MGISSLRMSLHMKAQDGTGEPSGALMGFIQASYLLSVQKDLYQLPDLSQFDVTLTEKTSSELYMRDLAFPPAIPRFLVVQQYPSMSIPFQLCRQTC